MPGAAGAGRRTLQGRILEYISTPYSFALLVRQIKKPIPFVLVFLCLRFTMTIQSRMYV